METSNKIEISFKPPFVGLFPVPVVLVSCIDLKRKKNNIVTVGWIGVACSDPPMLSCAIRPSRYSYNLIRDAGDFVVNIPTQEIVTKVDQIGMISGRDYDKFAEMQLSPVESKEIKSPMIRECPVNLECVVRNILELGSHSLFIGEIVVCHVDNSVVDSGGRQINFDSVRAFGVCGSEYRAVGEWLAEVYNCC